MGFVINIIVVIAYLVSVCYLAYKGGRRTRIPSDYMIAGREIPSGVMALSYGATSIGTAAIIGFGGAAALFGFSLLWLGFFTILVGVFISFVFFGKRTRRMGIALNAHTFPEVLGERYQSRFIQAFAGIVIFAFIPIYSAAIIIGIARLIEVALHIPYVIGLLGFSLFLALYVILGGIRGVRYIDTFQGLFMFVIMAILCYWTYKLLGGIIPAHQALTAIAPMVSGQFADAGHQGWTEGLTLGSPFWWVACSSIMYGVGIGTLVQPQLVVRFLKARSEREMDRSVLVAGAFMLAMTGVPLVVGPLTNVIFMQRFGAISITIAEGNMDKIIPVYVDKVMPWWFGILFLVGMLAASTAALRSQFHAGGTSLGRDFYARGMRFRRGGEVFTTQVGIALTIIATVLWGLVLPPNIIAVATALFFGVCAASFLPLYFLGLYWKGVTKAGAIASMVGGVCVSFIWMIFFHYLESAPLGICETLFGQVNVVAGSQYNPWLWQLQYVDPIAIALPISFALCIGVSRITRKMPKEHLKRCFRYITE
jgi:SSS family solute:Na+ symporter